MTDLVVERLKLLLALFRKGEELRNPAVWGNRVMLLGILTPFLVSLDELAKLSGINFGLTDTQIEDLSQLLASLLGIVVAMVIPLISRHVGLPAKPAPTEPTTPEDPKP